MALPCPNCGADLRLIEEYERQYCDACGQYAPEGYGGGRGLNCPKCGGVLTYIKEYERYYCHKDQEYAPEEMGREEPAPPAEPDLSSIDELLPPEPEPESEPKAPEAPPPAEPAPATAPAEPAPEVPTTEVPTRPMESRREEPPTAETRAIEATPEPRPVVARPPLVRENILRSKKAALMDLASAYGLDTMGTKETLRERLFARLVEIEREEEQRRKEERPKREEAEKAAPAAAEPAPGAPAPETPATNVVAPETPAEPRPVEPVSTPIETPRIESASPADNPAPAGAAMPFWQEAPPTPALAEPPKVEAEVPPAETPPAAAPAIAPEAPKVINPCPTCGRELSYIDKYDRYYCYNCKAYAPPVVKVVTVPAPPRVGKPCPTCGRELTYIPDYGRHYCYHCKKYAASEGKPAEPERPSVEVLPPKPEPTPAPAPPPAVELVAVKNPCPTCGRELSYVERYGRFYCYSCKKYAPPRPRNPCPNCGKELRYIADYGRHYCPACGQYAPRELTARILAARSMAVTASMGGVAPPAVLAAAATRTVTIPVHQHGSPGGGVGLAAVGLIVLLLYEFLWAMPVAFGGVPYVTISDPQTTNALGWMLQFLGFLMLGLGVLIGLVRLRTLK